MKLRTTLSIVLLALSPLTASATAIPGRGTWETTLLGRDIAGNPTAADSAAAVFLYDTQLNITWLRDANYIATSGSHRNGSVTVFQARRWVDSLSVGGFSDWRLPRVLDTGLPGCSATPGLGTECGWNVPIIVNGVVYSELAHLYRVTLGNLSYGDTSGRVPQPGWSIKNTATFFNVGDNFSFWTGTLVGPQNTTSWIYDFYEGRQDPKDNGSIGSLALAVRGGDVLSAVPENSTLAFFLVGLLAIAVVNCSRVLHKG